MAFVAALSDGRHFTVGTGETVLDAALRQGVALEYGCRHGNCSRCKYYLSEGEVDCGSASAYSLSETEREEGFGLLCCATPLTDLVIETRGCVDPRAKPQRVPELRAAQVASVEPLTPAMWRLVLTLDAPLEFYPGQFVELNIAGTDVWRSYSVASAPDDGARLEFVIKRVAGGQFSARVPQLRAGDALSVRGPYGASYLRDGDDDVVLVATGSGIAPILSILQAAGRAGDGRRFALYYGARAPEDVPAGTLFADCTAALGERFNLHVTLSQPDANWTGLQGRVTRVLQRALDDASVVEAYVCGAPAMCDNVGALLEAKGIREGSLLFDRFHAAAR